VHQTDIAGYLHRYGMAIAKPMVDRFVANAHNAATVTLAPTPIARDALNDLGVKNLAVWGRGVDLEAFHPNNRFTDDAVAFRQNHAPHGELIIRVPPGGSPRKNKLTVFANSQACRAPGLFFIGDGPERARLQTMFPVGSVTFLGSLSGRELQIAYAAMDVLVHFGVEETFGQTIQEAQAASVCQSLPLDSRRPHHTSLISGRDWDSRSTSTQTESPHIAVQHLDRRRRTPLTNGRSGTSTCARKIVGGG